MTEPNLNTFTPELSALKLGSVQVFDNQSGALRLVLREDFRMSALEDQQILQFYEQQEQPIYMGGGVYEL